jgi:acyl-CoA synthetase (AMP-forming)/AMP-acid ligase II
MRWRPELEHEATVPALLAHGVERWGGRALVVTHEERLTYRDADLASRALAKRLLAAGVGKGTRVATHFPYGTAWIVSWLAISRIGALHVPFSTAYKPAELRKALHHTDAHLLVSPREMFGGDRQEFVAAAVGPLPDGAGGPLRLPALPYLREIWFQGGADVGWARGVSFDPAADDGSITDELLDAVTAEVTPADLAITISTSGTTSEPKAVHHTHGALVRKGAHLARLLGWTGDDVVFCGMPFFWVGGIAMTVAPAMEVGATLLCVDRTEPERSLDLMERERATRMTGWPGVRGPIESHPSRPGRGIPAFGPDLPPHRRSIGMTETLASYTYPRAGSDPAPGRDGCQGFPIDGVDVLVVDPESLAPRPEDAEGAILVRGYCLMQGMVKREREEVFTPDGFLTTGDKGYLLDGMLYFTGRLTEMIKTSGNNVAPPEVEAVMRSLPGVKDVHVLGVPDEERGELVAALVVGRPGVDLDPEELCDRAREQLSNYKVPRRVVIVGEDELPWLATGKPDRLAIRRMLEAAGP